MARQSLTPRWLGVPANNPDITDEALADNDYCIGVTDPVLKTSIFTGKARSRRIGRDAHRLVDARKPAGLLGSRAATM